MKLFIIGGTGLVGSTLLCKMDPQKDEISVLTRSESRREGLQAKGIRGITGDIRDIDGFRSALPEELDLIVLLAMPEVIPGKRISPKAKRQLREDTNAFFRNSMQLAMEYEVPVILPGGTSYLTRGDEVADESWPTRRAGLTEIGLDTDALVEEAIRKGRPKLVQMMYGRIYGYGGLFRFMYDRMEKGRMRIIGKGDNYIPNIHAADAASAILRVMEKGLWGEKFIIADDTAVSQRDFISFMAGLMDREIPGTIPLFAVRLILGRDFYEILRMNCKVSNRKAKEKLGWSPEYPSCFEGLPAIIREMKNQNRKSMKT
jgi:nucleoside-diphosphate-sugar epimerase